MNGTGGGERNREAGLSEVVGFVLIIAVLTVVFSLYLTYGVPAQGRENEILHMGVIKDQFVAYKLSLDSLSTNEKVGTTLSNSFTLGSGGSYTQGVMGFIPIMNPVSSGGIFSINRRTTTPETLNITSQSLIVDPGSQTSVDLPAIANFTPSHVYANVTISSSAVLDGSSSFGMVVNTTQWAAHINLTPQLTYYQYYWRSTTTSTSTTVCDTIPDASKNGTPINVFVAYTSGGSDTSTYGCLIPMYQYNYTGTDLTVSITKGNTSSMDKYPVYKNIQRGSTYPIDLMDSIYGLNSLTGASTNISLQVGQPMSQVTGTGNITYNFIEKSYSTGPIELGAVEYSSNNYYWIQQDYYYQIGGVFLSQIDGNNTYKLPPEISYHANPTTRIISVNINAIRITNPYGSSSVGGSSPVQIKSTLLEPIPFPYATGRANTKSLRIAINTSDDKAREMWTNYFNYTARVEGLPASTVVGKSGNESYILINGYDTSSSKSYDINLEVTNATYTAVVYGVGG